MKLFSLLVFIFFTLNLSAQVKGYVVEEMQKDGEIIEEPIPGVIVFWENSSEKAVTDADGHFTIEAPAVLPQNLIFKGFSIANDTILIEKAPLIGVKVLIKPGATQLKGATVTAKTSVISIDPAFKRLISSEKLHDAPCCNLSESFDRDATVDVNFTDAVSGTKKIVMLGLDGIYTQMLSENIPTMRGLSAPYGLTFVPGPWIDGISITKGTGSVVNGYESITGQINFDFKKPDKAEKLYVGVFANSNLRGELNLYSAKKLNKKWSTMLFAYANKIGNRVDNNGDGFLDDPLSTQINVFSRWKYFHNDFMTQFGVRALVDNRAGGQINFDNPTDIGSNTKYGFGADSKQVEGFVKGGMPFEFRQKTSIAYMASYRHHNQESFFGLKNYSGTMGSAYGNFMFTSYLGNTDHTFNTGLSYIHDDYKETYQDNTIGLDSAFNRIESVPGAFFEYTYKNAHTFTLVAGIRGDLHSRFGFQYSPRLHMKWNPDESTSIRLSGGKGFRSPNAIIENASVFASSRLMKVHNTLDMEEALNYGVSLTREFEMFGNEATLIADYYRTDFINQVVVDLENSNEVHFYNLNGKSYSNAFQLDLLIEPLKGFEIGMAYKFTDVRTSYVDSNGQANLKAKPLVPVHRAMLAFDYKTANKKWKFSLTTNYFGTSRIPSTADNTLANQRAGISKEFFVMNFQATKKFKIWEAYIGVENLLGTRQMDPIIGVDDPFGQEFDASLVWGPLMGQVGYAGIRLKLKNK